MQNPHLALSTIGDGMAQVHNLLPHLGAAGGALCPKLDTHLQGLLVHGKRFAVYRHFNNVPKGFNVAAYAWLSELDNELRANGKLPQTLYHQIDGGSENASALTLALAELLVHRGLAKKIVITRLPVGHTHGTFVSPYTELR